MAQASRGTGSPDEDETASAIRRPPETKGCRMTIAVTLHWVGGNVGNDGCGRKRSAILRLRKKARKCPKLRRVPVRGQWEKSKCAVRRKFASRHHGRAEFVEQI